MTLLRSILASLSEADVKAGDGLVQQLKIYPLSKAANPPAQRFLDMTDVTGICRHGRRRRANDPLKLDARN